MSLSISDEEAEVTDAGRVEDGFNAAMAGQFDVAVIDRRLPDGDGLDLVRRLREVAGTSELPIIVLTAGYDPAHLDEVMDAGANEYLAKPIEPAALVAACRRVGSVPDSGAAAKKHRKQGRFRRRDRDEATAPLTPRVVTNPIETNEQTMRRARDASDARAAESLVEVNGLQLVLGALRHELDELHTALDEDADERASLTMRNRALEDELRSTRALLAECITVMEEQERQLEEQRVEPQQRPLVAAKPPAKKPAARKPIA